MLRVAVVSEKRSGATATAPMGHYDNPYRASFNAQRKDMNKTNKRTRNYATVEYPESAPVDWVRLLQEQSVPALISPLHDKDIYTDGTSKKSIIM